MKKLYQSIKGLSLFFIVFLFFGFSFSVDINQGTDTGINILKSIADIFNIIWLPITILAGKLLTNEVIYGQAFGLDMLLWNIWQVTRTFANYALGFILIAAIFLFLIGKLKESIISVIGKLSIGAILINASWFLIGVLIDISIVLIVTAGSLPTSLQTERLPKLKYCNDIVFKVDSYSLTKIKDGTFKQTCKSEGKVDFEKVYNNLNAVSGPLIYIGASILNIDKNWGISEGEKKQDIKKSMVIGELLRIGVIIMFVVPIFLLLIISIIRLFLLWIYIAFSPLLVLDYIFGSKVSKSKYLKLSNVVAIIFQPVLIVFALSVSLIFLLALQASFRGDDTKKQLRESLGICNNDSSLCINDIPAITIKGDAMNSIFSELGGVFGYLIISIMSLIVIWSMLKLVFHSSEITSGIASRTFDFAKDAFKAVPVVPTKYGYVGIGALQKGLSKNLISKNFSTMTSSQAELVTNKINELFGIGNYDLSISNYNKWREKFSSSFNSSIEKFNVYKSFLESLKGDIIPDSATYFKKLNYEFWIRLSGGDKNLAEYLGIKLSKNENLTEEKLFSNDKFRKMMYNLIKDPSFIERYSNLLTNPSFIGRHSNSLTNPKSFIDTVSKLEGSSGNLSLSVTQIRKNK